MSKNFNKVPYHEPPKKDQNKTFFDFSKQWKSQIQPGYIYPVYWEECMPGDNWKIKRGGEYLFRFAPMWFPIMTMMTMRCMFFWIPFRILWTYENAANKGWTRWITEQEDTKDLIHPFVNAEMKRTTTSFNNHILGFMGIPTIPEVPGDVDTVITELNAFPLSAYIKIWDEYYRIPQLEDEIWFPLEPGDNTTAFEDAINPNGLAKYYPVLSSKWGRDYFTTATPTPQIGEAIKVPMFTDGPLTGLEQIGYDAATGMPIDTSALGTDAAGVLTDNIGAEKVLLDTSETAATIKQLRLAEALQSFYERMVKVGQRYRDFIKGMWGPDPMPSEIDQPVLIGSVYGRIQISDVMTQATTFNGGQPVVNTGDYMGQANMYANGGDDVTYNCKEHGLIMGLMEVNPDTSYGQGIARFWRRNVQQDYPLDMFAHTGDQEILKEEVMYNAYILEESLNQLVFGYQEKYGEMKFPNNIHVMEMNYGNGLSQHLGRWWKPSDTHGLFYQNDLEINTIFTNVQNIIEDIAVHPNAGGIRLTDTFRILPGKGIAADSAEGIIYCHIFFSVDLHRNLPLHSTPDLT